MLLSCESRCFSQSMFLSEWSKLQLYCNLTVLHIPHDSCWVLFCETFPWVIYLLERLPEIRGEKKASHFKSLEVSKKKKKTKQKTKTKNKNNKKTIPISHHHQQKKQTNKKHPTNCNNQEEITVKSNYNKSTHRSTLQYQLLEDSRKY